VLNNLTNMFVTSKFATNLFAPNVFCKLATRKVQR